MVMGTLATLLLSAAQAQTPPTATVKVCVHAQLNFADADLGNGEDYFESNGIYPLRGVRIRLDENFGTGFQSAYADWTGNDQGCAVFQNISTVAGETYRVSMRTQLEVNTSHLEVRRSYGQKALYEAELATAQSFSQATQADYTIGPHRSLDVAAAASSALARHTGGYALTPTFYLPDATGQLTVPAACDGPCIVNGDDVYISEYESSRKFAVAYRLGWVLVKAISPNWGTDSFDSACSGPGDSTLASVETSRYAAADGLAFLYASFAFNRSLPGDESCQFTYWKSMDWDEMGAPCFDRIDTPIGQAISCFTGRAPLVPPRNHRSYCSFNASSNPVAHTATAIDHVRLWWDLMNGYTPPGGTEVTPTLQDIVNLYEASVAASPQPPGLWGFVSTATHLGLTEAEWLVISAEHGL